jgi:purine-binding chemotaxis protein CheW
VRDVLEARAAALRDEFDRSFAVPAQRVRPDELELLAIRIGDARFAVRLAGLAGVSAVGRICPLPGGAPGLLGLVALGGGLVPLFGLGVLLGTPAVGDPIRWALGVPGQPAIALGCEGLDGLIRVPAGAVASERGDVARPFVEGVAVVGDAVVPLVEIGALEAAIRGHAGRRSDKEI